MRKIVRQERLKDDKKARLIEAAIEEFNKAAILSATSVLFTHCCHSALVCALM